MLSRRPGGLAPVRAVKVRPGRHLELPEQLAVEEPMEIRAAGPGQQAVPVAVTMRTPGNDFELAAGFLVTEGLARPGDVAAVGYCDAVDVDEGRFNTVTVSLSRPWTAPPARPFTMTASCGICGKSSIDQVEVACPPVAALEPGAGLGDPDPARPAAGLAAACSTGPGDCTRPGCSIGRGDLLCVREDVGRHNAVDKVAGPTVLTRERRRCPRSAGACPWCPGGSASRSCRRRPSAGSG